MVFPSENVMCLRVINKVIEIKFREEKNENYLGKYKLFLSVYFLTW